MKIFEHVLVLLVNENFFKDFDGEFSFISVDTSPDLSLLVFVEGFKFSKL